jgi:hypothetical protein
MNLSDKRDKFRMECLEVATTPDEDLLIKTIFEFIIIQDKQAIKELKEEDEDYEARIIGLVWGLCSKEPFNSKYFNNKFNFLRLEHIENKNKILGEELSR